MFLILLAIVIAAAIFLFMVWYGDKKLSDGWHLFGMLGLVGTGATMLWYAILSWDYIAADYKAKIINREYGTSYTQEEVFYASDVIDTVRELNRKRIEVNGNLMQEQEHSHKK